MAAIKLTKINKDVPVGYYAGRVITGACFVNGVAVGTVGKKNIGDPLVNRRSGEVFVTVATNEKGKKGIYISAPEHPTTEEYTEMKTICAKYGWTMPVYDRRAYAGVKRYIAESMHSQNVIVVK